MAVFIAYDPNAHGILHMRDWSARLLGGHPKPASRGHLKTGQLKP